MWTWTHWRPTIRRGAVLLHGFFQRYGYYAEHRNRISGWFRRTEAAIPGEDDEVVVAVRRGDYIRLGWTLPFDYYRRALERLRFRRIRLISDDYNDPWLNQFSDCWPVVKTNGDAMHDFDVLRGAKQIVIANSTFAWWGAFLSTAERVIAAVFRSMELRRRRPDGG